MNICEKYFHMGDGDANIKVSNDCYVFEILGLGGCGGIRETSKSVQAVVMTITLQDTLVIDL